jgi:hypothetical protein
MMVLHEYNTSERDWETVDEINNMKNKRKADIILEKVFSLSLFSFVSVSMVREKDDGSDYNGRRGELIAYDHTPLDGEFFLQVS